MVRARVQIVVRVMRLGSVQRVKPVFVVMDVMLNLVFVMLIKHARAKMGMVVPIAPAKRTMLLLQRWCL